MLLFNKATNVSMVPLSLNSSYGSIFGCLCPPYLSERVWREITNILASFSFHFPFLRRSVSSWIRPCRAGVTFDVWTPIVFFYVVVRSRARSVSWTLALSLQSVFLLKTLSLQSLPECKEWNCFEIYYVNQRARNLYLSLSSKASKKDFFLVSVSLTSKFQRTEHDLYINASIQSTVSTKIVSFWYCDLLVCVWERERERESREFLIYHNLLFYRVIERESHIDLLFNIIKERERERILRSKRKNVKTSRFEIFSILF